MKINWKIKSFIFFLVDKYKIYNFLYFIQKFVTRKSIIKIESINPKWIIHKNNLASLVTPTIIEFGAGKNLAQNIYLSQFVGSQLLVDIRSMLDIKLVNHSFKQLSKICTNLNFQTIANKADLIKFFNIYYDAPFNLIHNKLEENSFDACVSTDTLEHIPIIDLKNIFQVLQKILKPYGLISAVVDYSDHYSHSDSSISKLNFLQYDDVTFEKYNHPSHYQNRLRHYQYEDLFIKLGYKVLKSVTLETAPLPDNISSQFDKTNLTTSATQGFFLLQNLK